MMEPFKMAISKAIPIPVSHDSLLDADRHDMLGLTLSAALPLAVFIIANGVAELNGYAPLFFSPFAIPGWIGAAMHLACLPLFGIARWMVAERGARGRTAGWWLVALMAGMIAIPFVVAPLDSFALSTISVALLLLGTATALRVAHVSRRAGWVMLPALGWLGFSAAVGLMFVAAWAPPFALTNSNVTSV
jgi:hypothetical protein